MGCLSRFDDAQGGGEYVQENGFYREFDTPIALSDAAKDLPDMRGAGFVHDLREAASVSSGLAGVLQTYAQAGSRDAQLALLDGVILAWAQSSGQVRSLEEVLGLPCSITISAGAVMNAAQFRTAVSVLEVFNGTRFYQSPIGQGPVMGLGTASGGGGMGSTPSFVITPPTAQLNSLQQGMDALRESVYDALVMQTRLRPYLDAIELTIDENGIGFDTSKLAAKLEAARSADARNALIDLVELNRYGGETLRAVEFAGIETLRSWVSELPAGSPLLQELADLHVYFNNGAVNNGSAHSDIYLGTEAGNTFFAGDGDDLLDGGAGNDFLYGGNGNDTLLGGEGNDYLYGGAGNDVLEGGAGNDTLRGDEGSDTYRFARGWGLDTINNCDSSANRWDVIEFAAGIAAADIAVTRSGNNLILSLRGSTDQIMVESYFNADGTSPYRLDEIRFADGTSWGIDQVKTMTIQGTAGVDNLRGYAGDDVIHGGAGNDYIYGGSGNDMLYGDEGDDYMQGEAGDDTLHGGTGNDSLFGGDGNDTLYGDEGNDTLYGGAGDDILEGGVGNDYLYGEAGSDTYRFARGWGQDTVNNYDISANKWDVIEFAAGITAADIAITLAGDNLILSLKDGTDTIIVNNYFYQDGASSYRLEEIRFADGTRWGIDQVKALAIQGTAGADNLRGYATDDVIHAGAGNDYVYGGAGNDVLHGDEGNDTLFGEAGDDTLYGGNGNDSLYGGDGNDMLYGGEGGDYLSGGAGDDILEGGAGNDTLSGDAGSDTYRFARGWGQDVISNYDTAADKCDAIEFAAGITASDIAITREGDSLILSLKGGTDKVTVSNYFYQDGTSSYRLEEIRFADGTRWSIDQVKVMAIQGTAGTDSLRGYATDDVIYAGAGDDTVYGGNGNDVLYGEDGNDVLYGEAGDDTLFGGAGNDSLYGGDGNDVLYGGEGNDYLYGGAGDDILEGGEGNDSLEGGAGSDTYRFARGWGQDTISNYDTSTNKWDVIEFAAGIAATDIAITRSGDSLVLSLKGSTDKIAVSSYFYQDGASNYRLEEIRFADGTRWGIDQVKVMAIQGTVGADTLHGYATDDVIYAGAGDDAVYGGNGNDVLYGEDGNDVLYGEAGDDTLYGGEGNDYLYGGAGNDILEGGAGNDYLSGDAGSDTYRFARGWGQDTISNYDSSANKWDVIEFAAGIVAADIAIARSGDNLVLSLKGGTDKITVSNYFYQDGASNYRLEEIRFADGTRWSIDQVKVMAIQGTVGADNLRGYATDDVIYAGAGDDTVYGDAGDDVLYGEEGNDSLYGGDGNDTLYGGEGNDYLYGGAGNDILEGGAGNDYLDGGTGNDTYRFARGWGQDTVNNYDTSSGKWDVIEFAAGITAADIILTRSSDNLILSLKGSTDKITVSNYFYQDGASSYRLEEIRFADGTRWGIDQVKVMAIQGTAGADTLRGYATDDVIYAGAGDDTIYGGNGNDTLYGEDGNDTLNGDAGDDTLHGGAGNDYLSGGDGNDTLYGGEGNDYLYGGAGNDILEGGAGNDYLDGGTGNDTYRFARGWGQDTVYDYDTTVGNTDVASFGEGIGADQLWFRQSGSSLEVSLIGTTDKISISNWYSGSQYHVEQFKTSDGKVLLDSQVQSLVQAMAAFSPPAAGQTTLPDNYQASLNAVIAANWR